MTDQELLQRIQGILEDCESRLTESEERVEIVTHPLRKAYYEGRGEGLAVMRGELVRLLAAAGVQWTQDS